MIEISNKAKLPTIYGEFFIQSFKEDDKEHLVIFNEIKEIINLRIHSECLTGDAIGSIKCDCRAQLEFALNYINKHKGMVIYLRQEGRGIGLFNKVNAYSLQDKGLNTIEANHQLGFNDDERDYSIVEFILNYYKIQKVNILTNNPIKLRFLDSKINKRIPIEVGITDKNLSYLKTKKTQMGHLLEL